MSPKAASRSSSTKKTTKAKPKRRSSPSAKAKAKRTSAAKPTPSRSKASTKKAVKKTSRRPRRETVAAEFSPTQLLARAEADITTAIETLNTHMTAALAALTDLATAQSDRGREIIRTAPLDRATATFQRLVAEMVDDQLAEMLPPLIALRNEMSERRSDVKAGQPSEPDFHRRGAETLDHVLTLAGAQAYEARAGEMFDPLIHLAVGENHRSDLAEGTVAEPLQPGFRSARGKVLVPAKVRVNRR